MSRSMAGAVASLFVVFSTACNSLGRDEVIVFECDGERFSAMVTQDTATSMFYLSGGSGDPSRGPLVPRLEEEPLRVVAEALCAQSGDALEQVPDLSAMTDSVENITGAEIRQELEEGAFEAKQRMEEAGARAKNFLERNLNL